MFFRTFFRSCVKFDLSPYLEPSPKSFSQPTGTFLQVVVRADRATYILHITSPRSVVHHDELLAIECIKRYRSSRRERANTMTEKI